MHSCLERSNGSRSLWGSSLLVWHPFASCAPSPSHWLLSFNSLLPLKYYPAAKTGCHSKHPCLINNVLQLIYTLETATRQGPNEMRFLKKQTSDFLTVCRCCEGGNRLISRGFKGAELTMSLYLKITKCTFSIGSVTVQNWHTFMRPAATECRRYENMLLKKEKTL